MIGAWSGWLEFCELRQQKRERLAAAVTFWTHRELAAAFHQFRWIMCLHSMSKIVHSAACWNDTDAEEISQICVFLVSDRDKRVIYTLSVTPKHDMI